MHYQLFSQYFWPEWSLKAFTLASLLPFNISLLMDELFIHPALLTLNDLTWTVEAIKELICLYL